MFKIYFKTLPKSLTLISLIALIILVIKVIFLDDIPELFEHAHELGKLAEGILLSIVASYIFYLVVVHYKEVKEKSLLFPYSIEWCEGIVASSKNVISAIFDSKDIQYDFMTLTKDEMSETVAQLDPFQQNIPLYTNGKVTRKIGSYYGFFSTLHSLDLKALQRLQDSRLLLEPELLEIITEISGCTHFMMLPHYQAAINRKEAPGSPFQNGGEDIYEYYTNCLKLRVYLDKVITIYGRKIHV